MITRTTNVYDSWKETLRVEKKNICCESKSWSTSLVLFAMRNVLHLQCYVVLRYLLILLLLVKIFVLSSWNVLPMLFILIRYYYTRLLLSLFSVSRSLLLFPVFCFLKRTVELTLLHFFVVINCCCYFWFRTTFMQSLFDSGFVFSWLCCLLLRCCFLISFVPLPKLRVLLESCGWGRLHTVFHSNDKFHCCIHFIVRLVFM